MAARVTGSGNRDQIAINFHRLFTVDDSFDSQTLRAIVRVHHPLATKLLRKQLVVGNVVAVCQQHALDATKLLNSLYQVGRESRRIYQDISTFLLRSDY
jgi:hypothetical protein